MIPSFCIESRGKPILGSLTLVVVAIAIHRCYSDWTVLSRNDRQDKNDPKYDDKTEKICNRMISDDVNVNGYGAENKSDDGGTKEIRFPWEPNYVPKRGNKDNSTRQPRKNYPEKVNLHGSLSIAAFGSSRGRHNESRTTERSSTEELDFLATMTFANGGLRSPSCPCCV
jgi:hypothetical protein